MANVKLHFGVVTLILTALLFGACLGEQVSFIHIWASERDHLGDNHEVENMLKERWVKVE